MKAKRPPPNEAQRRGLAAASRRAAELRHAGQIDARFGQELVASLGENEGYVTRRSSPHVFWLADQLQKGIR